MLFIEEKKSKKSYVNVDYYLLNKRQAQQAVIKEKSDIKKLYFALCILSGSFMGHIAEYQSIEYLLVLIPGSLLLYAIGKHEEIL